MADKNPGDLVSFGHLMHLRKEVATQGFYSGGGGYVVSRAALDRLAGPGGRDPALCPQTGLMEDVKIGRCLTSLGVRLVEDADRDGHFRWGC